MSQLQMGEHPPPPRRRCQLIAGPCDHLGVRYLAHRHLGGALRVSWHPPAATRTLLRCLILLSVPFKISIIHFFSSFCPFSKHSTEPKASKLHHNYKFIQQHVLENRRDSYPVPSPLPPVCLLLAVAGSLEGEKQHKCCLLCVFSPSF